MSKKRVSERHLISERRNFGREYFSNFSNPLHPRRPQPSAQPSSLIPSGFFSQPISSHSLAPAVRAGKLADRWSPAASSPYRFAVRKSAQPSSLIPSGFFSPPISSHSLAPTPSAAVRTAKLAHPQRLLLPTHFQPLPCTHAVRSRPRRQARSSPAASSPYPFPATLAPTPSAAVRAAKLAHPQRLLLPTHFQPLPCTHAVRNRPRSQARSSPAASSPHPFPATPLHPRRPQPSAQPSSLIPSGFFSPPISSHSLAPTPSAAVHAANLAHPQRLLFPTHFQPPPCTHAVRSRPRSQARSSPAASPPQPFPATPLHPRRPQPSAQPSSLISSGFFSPPICRPQPSAQPSSLIPSGFFSPPISSHSFRFPSFPFLFLPFPSFPFPSLPFPSFPFLSLPFLSLPFLSCPFFPSFPFLSLAPTPSAHHRLKQLAPHAVKQLNENPSIEDAFGYNPRNPGTISLERFLEKSSLVQTAANVRPAGWGERERMCTALKVHASHG